MHKKKYAFFDAPCDVKITADTLYSDAQGCGLIGFAGAKREKDRVTGTGGFNPADNLSCTVSFSQEEKGVRLAGENARLYPLRFRAPVPGKGVYRITAVLTGGSEGAKNVRLYTGRRNLVQRDIALEAGETFTKSFYVHVCEYIPVIGEPMKTDLSVYVSVLGENVLLSSVEVEEADAPTLFIAGDSLVADYDTLYPYNPLTAGGSWGQHLLQYFSGLAVNNQAHGGLTTNCFRDDGHWEIIRRNIRPGDIFMMEFGHNDQKRRNLKAYVQYAANLRWYIAQIREMGAYPVIVTSLSRIPSMDEDGYYDLLEEYAQSCLRVGKECKVPVIDLHDYSFRLLCDMGIDVCKNYFNDTTHVNDYGALIMAKFIAEEISRQQLPALTEKRNDFNNEPWEPDLTLRPADAVSSAEKEERPILPTDLPDLPYADCRHIRNLAEMKEAMWKGLLDPCIIYYHPFEEMPRGQFLYLFFKAVASPAKRPYQGKYCDIYRYEFDAQNVQAALDANLIDESTTPDSRFRPDDALTGGELVSMMIRSLHDTDQRNISMSECERQAKSLGLLWEAYGKNEPVNRLDATVALVHLMNVTKEEAAGLPF